MASPCVTAPSHLPAPGDSAPRALDRVGRVSLHERHLRVLATSTSSPQGRGGPLHEPPQDWVRVGFVDAGSTTSNCSSPGVTPLQYGGAKKPTTTSVAVSTTQDTFAPVPRWRSFTSRVSPGGLPASRAGGEEPGSIRRTSKWTGVPFGATHGLALGGGGGAIFEEGALVEGALVEGALVAASPPQPPAQARTNARKEQGARRAR